MKTKEEARTHIENTLGTAINRLHKCNEDWEGIIQLMVSFANKKQSDAVDWGEVFDRYWSSIPAKERRDYERWLTYTYPTVDKLPTKEKE